MVRGDHPETFLLKALFCQSVASQLKVVGWWWVVVVAHEIILSSPGFPSPSPSPVPVSRLTKILKLSIYQTNSVPEVSCKSAEVNK